MSTVNPFDDHERVRWTGRAAAYDRSFAKLCAHPAAALLDAAGVAAGPRVDAAGVRVDAAGVADGVRVDAAGVRVLDVGTGPGTVAALAAARGAKVVAVDPEPGMLELTAARVPTAALLRAALPTLPFAPATFDARRSSRIDQLRLCGTFGGLLRPMSST